MKKTQILNGCETFALKYTRARMLDSIYHDIKITLTSHFCLKNVIILSLCMQRCYGRHNFPKNL